MHIGTARNAFFERVIAAEYGDDAVPTYISAEEALEIREEEPDAHVPVAQGCVEHTDIEDALIAAIDEWGGVDDMAATLDWCEWREAGVDDRALLALRGMR